MPLFRDGKTNSPNVWIRAVFSAESAKRYSKNGAKIFDDFYKTPDGGLKITNNIVYLARDFFANGIVLSANSDFSACACHLQACCGAPPGVRIVSETECGRCRICEGACGNVLPFRLLRIQCLLPARGMFKDDACEQRTETKCVIADKGYVFPMVTLSSASQR